MQLTGYPRMDISIMEDVIRANAPDSIKSDPTKMATINAKPLTASAALSLT